MVINRLIGYDRGYGWIKAVDRDQTLKMPSFVVPGRPAPGLRNTATMVEIEGVPYLVGESAVKQAGLALEPSLREDEHTSRDSRQLAIAALGLLAAGPGTYQFHVVSGLPHILMDTQAQRVMNMLEEIKQVPVTVSRGERRYSCVVNVSRTLILPQGLGVAMDFCLGEGGMPKQEIQLPFPLEGRTRWVGKDLLQREFLVLDVGFNTALTYAISDLEPMIRFCRGSFHGMAYAYQLIGQSIQGRDAWAVQDLIARGVLRSEQYEWAFRQLAEQINRQVANFKHPFDFYLVGGGGGEALFNHLLPDLARKVRVSDPQYGNARGYRKAGLQQWSNLLAHAGS